METLSKTDVIDLEKASGFEFGPFYKEWLMMRAPEKVTRWIEKERERVRLGYAPIVATRQGLMAADINDPLMAAGTIVSRNNSVSEINLLGDSANGTCPQAIINQFCAISPNDARAGKMYVMKFGGIHSTTGTPTLILTPRWGTSTTVATNVSLGVSQTLTTGSGVSAQPFFGEFVFTIHTNPAGATQATGKGHGFAVFGTSTTAAAPVTMGKTAATVDTTGQGTAGCGMTMNVTWGTASASNAITPETFIIFSAN